MKTFNKYALHYIKALVASSFNAGILAIKAGFAQAGGAAFTSGVPAPTVHEIVAIFFGAALWEAVNFLAANPIPVDAIPALPPNTVPPSVSLPPVSTPHVQPAPAVPPVFSS